MIMHGSFNPFLSLHLLKIGYEHNDEDNVK